MVVRSYRVIFWALGTVQKHPRFLAILTPYCLGFQKSPSAPFYPFALPPAIPEPRSLELSTGLLDTIMLYLSVFCSCAAHELTQDNGKEVWLPGSLQETLQTFKERQTHQNLWPS